MRAQVPTKSLIYCLRLQVVLCDLRSTLFCSPFVNFQTDRTDNVTYGDLHDDNYVDSESIRIQLNPRELQNFRVDVPVRVNKSGTFFVLAEVVFFLSNEALYPNPIYVGSVTNIPLDKSAQITEFFNGPEILTTSQRSEIVSYVLIGLSGCVMLFLLFQAIKHRKNQVLMLSQGLFLIAMLFSGLVGMVGSIFFNPKTDLYCNMLGPMLVVPVHVFYSIILARLWRIYAVMSPLLLLTLEREPSFSTRMVNILNRVTTCQHRRKLHRKVTDGQLARVVALWASPQIILQILRWVLTPNEVMFVYNEDLSKGMPVCNGIYQNKAPEVLSGVFLVVQFIMMWILASQSKDLPSLFNEASVIFDVTLVSLIILTVAAVVIAMTRGTTMSPNVQYTIGVLAALAMVLNTSLKLVLPKLRMAWRGETIVVNKLFADHNRQRREMRTSRIVKFDVYEMESSEMELERNISRNEDDDSSEESSIVLLFGGSTAALMDSSNEEEELPPIAEASLTEEQLERILLEQNGNANSETVRQRPTLNMAFPRTKPTNHTSMRSRRIVVSGERLCSEPCMPATNAESQRTRMFAAAFGSVRSFATAPTAMGRQQSMQKFAIDYNPKVQDKIVVSETEPPSRRLLLRMIDAQRLLAQTNRTVLAGSTVSKEDWDEIRRVAVELGGVFQEDVEFQWESNVIQESDDSNLIQRRPSPATSP